jgi:enoyl-CoA hydratase
MADVELDRQDRVLVVSINRPEVRNAVDRPTADALVGAFRDFDADADLDVAILTGGHGYFCAGADLGALAGGGERMNRLDEDGDGPMGPSRMLLGKPVIAAVEGYAVAGGLELALWCDMRVAAESAIFGVFCRRWGVPLIDGGTVRLPRIVGMGRAMDIILTGRDVPAGEALQIGLCNRVVPDGQALSAALTLAKELSALPQACLRSDRLSAYEAWNLDLTQALRNEHQRGMGPIESGETLAGAQRFASGAGRHGAKATGE